MCDRSLATVILFDQCPNGRTEAALGALADCPPEMGFSYPANAGWRLWALAKGGRADVVVNDLRARWAKMESVEPNNTLQCEGELVVSSKETLKLETSVGLTTPSGLVRYRVAAGKTTAVHLQFT